jgi:hypothetical protein
MLRRDAGGEASRFFYFWLEIIFSIVLNTWERKRASDGDCFENGDRNDYK